MPSTFPFGEFYSFLILPSILTHGMFFPHFLCGTNSYSYYKTQFLESFFLIILFIYLCLAVLSFHCCVGFSLVVASRGYSLVAMNVLLIAWLLLLRSTCAEGVQASVVRACGLSRCSSQALEHKINSCGS